MEKDSEDEAFVSFLLTKIKLWVR